jgi:hypothetical protein
MRVPYHSLAMNTEPMLSAVKGPIILLRTGGVFKKILKHTEIYNNTHKTLHYNQFCAKL